MTGQDPCLYTAALPLRLGLVFNLRVTPYTALSNGLIARRTFFTVFGVTLRLTARTGCTALRIPRGMNIRDRKPT